ncbi:hypothetical protein GCM10011366_21860 [Ornithinimicrobium tianjinense]|uniref:Uncharacterized protein n=1 Tax=Ornithinimicrobium tianjinense TaxID=1195761 RepID=A0A917BT97_9MICO|nr:hypothetical protein GCM10011366_21860 [Ornithinimicrobium tianjinense]
MCLLDDDDIWHHDKQRQFASYIEKNPECGAVRSAYWQFSPNQDAIQLNGFRTELFEAGDRRNLERLAATSTPLNDFGYLDIQGRSLQEMLKRNSGVTSSTMVRRDVLDQVPDVPDALRSAQDWLLFVYIASIVEWHLVPGRWFFYRVHGEQITSDVTIPKWESRVLAWGEAWRNVGRPMGFHLRDYEAEYASELHQWVWAALRRGDRDQARRIYAAGSSFMVSWPIRWSVWLPPALRWRVRRPLAWLVAKSPLGRGDAGANDAARNGDWWRRQ